LTNSRAGSTVALLLPTIQVQAKSSKERLGGFVKRIACSILFVLTLLIALPSIAQNPNYDVGPVWRVNYYHIKSGQADAFWKDFREHAKPLYEEYKKAGLINDYKVWTNPTTERPDDWDVAVGLLFANWATMDQIDAKAATITTKHYGSREAMIEAGKKRNDLRELLASHLAREVMPK
jgi:hypothetical protein